MMEFKNVEQDVRREAKQALFHVALQTGVNGHHHDQHQHSEHHADQRNEAERGEHRAARIEIPPGEKEAEGTSFDAAC